MALLRSLALSLLALAALAPVVAAAPSITDSPKEKDRYLWATVGEKVELGSVGISDAVPCLDNTGYDEENETFIDPLKNDDDMLGATMSVETLQGEQWVSVANSGAEVTNEELQNNCELEPTGGSIELYPLVRFDTPSERTQVRLRVVGGQAGMDLTGPAMTVWPRFRERWSWAPGIGTKSIRKGYQTVTVKADPRLVGTRAVLLWTTMRGKTYREVQTRTFRLRGKNAYLRMQRRLPKNGDWKAYVCLDYYQRFPQMSNGVPCPRGKISRQKLEELFPGSTVVG